MTTTASSLPTIPESPQSAPALLAVVVHAANIQSLPRTTTRGPGRRQAGAGQTVGSVSKIVGGSGPMLATLVNWWPGPLAVGC